jgi:RNA polymerase primary sigma factor
LSDYLSGAFSLQPTRTLEVLVYENLTFPKFSRAEERELACTIHDLERRARAQIADIMLADSVLRQCSVQKERTRASTVDRLALAVQSCLENDSGLTEQERVWAKEAAQLLQDAEELYAQLAMSGLPGAKAEAKKLMTVMEFDDLLHEGFIGLMDAAKRFDPDRGVRFNTYSRWWARARMTRAIDRGGRPVRLPSGFVEDQRQVRRLIRQAEHKGATLDIDALSEQTGLNKARLRLLLADQHTKHIDDVDEPSIDRSKQPDQIVMLKDAINRLHEELAQLGNRERFVLTRYYLENDGARTLEDIGKEMGVTRERVRQIGLRGLRKLRVAYETPQVTKLESLIQA